MLRVNGNTVVLCGATFSNERPVSVLLSEVETGSVGNEEPSDERSDESKPADNPESGTSVREVVVHDGGDKGTGFTASGRETVSGGSDRDGEDFGRKEESSTVRTELLEEGREVVDGLETSNTFRGLQLFVPDGRDQEEDTVHEETDDLHPLSTVKLVVNQTWRPYSIQQERHQC